MSEYYLDACTALRIAKAAYSCGKKLEARKFASAAIQQDPNLEEAWLILAALGTPQASIAYLHAVLQINPGNTQAEKGLAWATKRLEKSKNDYHSPKEIFPHLLVSSIPYAKRQKTPILRKTRRAPGDLKQQMMFLLSSLILIFLVFLLSVIPWFLFPSKWVVFADNFSNSHTNVVIEKPTLAPVITSTLLPEIMVTPTVNLIPSQQVFSKTTPLNPTSPSISENMLISHPRAIITTVPMLLPGVKELPDGVGSDEKWIDVNMSNQTIYAMEGTELINSFRVSTGKSDTPTVGGKFHIYQKLLTSPMSGEDYYYPEIPFVMYFYQGYGFHGVVWPLKLGVPTSHGCVNMLTPDAEWLYNWADVGTLINVHF